MSAYHKIRMTGMIIRFAYRWSAGRNLFSERRTNATFRRRGTFSIDPTKTTPAWEFLPGWQRLALRSLAAYLLLCLLLCLLLLPFSSVLPWYLRSGLIFWSHAGVFGALLLQYAIRSRIRAYGLRLPLLVQETKLTEQEEEIRSRHIKIVELIPGRREWEQEIILPVGRALVSQLQLPNTERDLRRIVSIPRDFHTGGIAEVHLPQTFTGADAAAEKRIVRTIQARLGLREKDDISVSWILGGSDPLLRFHLPEKLPTLVTFSEVRHFLEAMGEWDFFYGIVAGWQAFSISLTADTPHGSIGAGSGAGKSELIKNKLAQAGHKGWSAIILDWKDESQDWAKGLRGVRYVTEIPGIHDMLVNLGDEVDYRKTLGREVPKRNTLVVLEEWQITAPLLADYWSMLRSTADPEEKKTMPLRSPALSAMMKLVYTGRSLGLFVELVAIRFSARVTNGNADMRECFQLINMARWKPQTVKMLAPNVRPFPKKPKERGRWVATDDETAVVYQAPLWTDQEARDWFTSGVECPASPWMLRGHVGDLAVDTQRNTQEDPLGLDPARPNERPAIEATVIDARKLSDMVEGLAPLGITLDVLRNEAKRDPAFPGSIGGAPNTGYTYDYSEVRLWARTRFATRTVEGSQR